MDERSTTPGPSRTLSSPPEFVVRHSWLDDVAIVEVAGEIDIATGQVLADALAVAARAAARGVVVNLAAVSFLDSSALHTLASAQRALAEQEIPLSIVKPADPGVSRVFEFAQLPDPLIIVDSLDAALAEAR